jgi:hypothetical protein
MSLETDLAAFREYDLALTAAALEFRPLPKDWEDSPEWSPLSPEIPHILMTDGKRAWLADWWGGAWRCSASRCGIPREAIGYRAFRVQMGDA